MSAPDDRRPDDELTRRHHEANAQDMRRPGTHVRQAVQAHAQAMLASKKDRVPAPTTVRAEAANQSRWKVSMLASIALVGLTGLLVLQFDRGTPEEKELALGQPRATAPVPETPASTTLQEAAPTPPPASAKKTAPALATHTQPDGKDTAGPGQSQKQRLRRAA